MAAINQGLENSGLTAAEASRRAFGNPYFIYGITKKGHVPSVDNFSKLCRVLGLEIHIQSPETLRLGAPEGESGPVDLSRLPELERSVHTLARLVADAGGDQIPEDLRPALADPGISAAEILDLPGARQIEVRELAAAAGGGARELDETVKGYLAFQRTWLDRHGIDPTQCTVIGVEGESMEPTLRDGCSILVDRSRRRRLVRHVYVVRSPDEGIVVKRLAKNDGGGWLLGSDHPAWKPVPWPDGAEVVGEVRWVAMTLTTC